MRTAHNNKKCSCNNEYACACIEETCHTNQISYLSVEFLNVTLQQHIAENVNFEMRQIPFLPQ